PAAGRWGGLVPRRGRPALGYGCGADADVRAVKLERRGMRSSFEVIRPGRSAPLAVTLNLPGRHNVLNALAAIAVATELEIDDAAIGQALAEFQGIDRRLQTLGELDTARGRIALVDDYAHH